MKKLIYFILCVFVFSSSFAKPKLIVGLVVDQMRWDFLYRYENRYDPKGGFKTLLNNGFSCQNTYIPYIPTVTACGHASIYTGSTPSIHGVVGNEWFNRKKNKNIHSVFDDSFGTSPKNLAATTIGDQIKLASNFKSKVFSVAIKDRASVLPGGHSANMAFWWNKKTGNWQTSSYYKNNLEWFKTYSSKELVDSLYNLNWESLYPLETYTNSTTDLKIYEKGLIDKNKPIFSYNLQQYIQKDYEKIIYTPYGNTLTLNFASHLIKQEALGKNPFLVPDMISISLSSTDIIGHSYGPFSIETEDTYLRLDKEIANFISFLDNYIGRNDYLLFLTSDHGVAPIPEFLDENNILMNGRFLEENELKKINTILFNSFKIENLVLSFDNFQLYLNKEKITSNQLNYSSVVDTILQHYQMQENVLYVFESSKVNQYTMPTEIKEKFLRGYHTQNSGDIQIIFKPFVVHSYNLDNKGTSHASWNSYDSHIPLIWFGGLISQGESYQIHYNIDIAPTLTSLLNIEAPSCSIGSPILELFNPIEK